MKTFTKFITLLFTLLIATTASASYDSYRTMLIYTAEVVGIDTLTHITTAKLESGFKSTAVNKHSNAGGLFQFTNGTWHEMIDLVGAKYGFTHNTKKTNAYANAILAAELTKKNTKYIQKVLGRKAVPGEVYATHLLGIGGASKLFRAKGNVSAAALLPNAAKGNYNIFYTKTGKARTARQLRDYLNWRIIEKGQMFVDDIGVTVIARI